MYGNTGLIFLSPFLLSLALNTQVKLADRVINFY